MARRNKDAEKEEVFEDEGRDPRVYELGFHLDPDLPTEEAKKSYHSVRELIEGSGVVVAEGEPEKIQLAYTISKQETSGRRDFNSAYFCWIAYEASPENHTQIITAVSAKRHIIRFIDLVTTKDAARHAAELHEFSVKMSEKSKEEPSEEEAPTGTELDAALEHALPFGQREAV